MAFHRIFFYPDELDAGPVPLFLPDRKDPKLQLQGGDLAFGLDPSPDLFTNLVSKALTESFFILCTRCLSTVFFAYTMILTALHLLFFDSIALNGGF